MDIQTRTFLSRMFSYPFHRLAKIFPPQSGAEMIIREIENTSWESHHAVLLDYLCAELINGRFAIPTRKSNRSRVLGEKRSAVAPRH